MRRRLKSSRNNDEKIKGNKSKDWQIKMKNVNNM